MPLRLTRPKQIPTGPVVTKAIHASAALHDWYKLQLNIIISKMAGEVSREVLAVYGTNEPPELAKDARTENPSLKLKAVMKRMGSLWTKRIDRLSLDLAREFAKRSGGLTQQQMKIAFKEVGFTVKFEPTPGSAAAYQAVIAEQVNLIKSIPQQYLKDVESRVWTSVMAGADMHTLATNLRKTYGITTERASLIARDQNNKAKAIIEKARREELNITHAILQHSAAGKVPRRSHVKMSGKPFLISQGFWDEDEGRYVLPGELINCRCTSRSVIPGYETPEQAQLRHPNTPYLQAALKRSR